MSKFEIGKSYYAVSVCDSNCKWVYKVVGRTAKRVTLQAQPLPEQQYPCEDIITKGIRIFDGCEECLPLGRYSMAPILSADKIINI